MSLLLFFPAPATPEALSGTVSGEATITGTLTVRAALSGTVSGEATITGTLTVRAALSGTVEGDARITGGAPALHGTPLSGSIAGEAQIVTGLFDVHHTGTTAAQAAAYRLAVVDRHGVLYGFMPKATITKIGWKLNEPAEVSFNLLTLDPEAALLPMATFPNREIQIWRKRTDKPLWWGRPLHPNAGRETLAWTGKDLLSWFGTRNIGKPKHNFLVNGGFDVDPEGTFPPTGWTRVGIDAPDGAIVVNNMIQGGKAVQMNAPDDQQAYLEQIVPGITFSADTPYVAAVWFYTASIHWLGPAWGALGLMIQACAADGSVLNAYWDGGLVDTGVTQDGWLRLAVLCGRPAGVDHYRYRLYAPGGWNVYDDAELVLPEGLSYPDTDLGEMLESLSVHAQSSAEGKSDLNIGRSHTTTGRKIHRGFPFEEHPNYLSTMQEYTGVENGVDISVQWPDAHTRIFTVHSPQQGTTRATTLTYSANAPSNCSDFTLAIDGETIATSVTEVGPGTGPEREEANAQDTTELDGLVLERIENLPSGSGIGELASRAAQVVAQAKQPIVALTMVTADVDLVDDWENGDLGLGDTVNAVVDWGWVQFAEPLRIVACELDPAMEALSLTLNRDPIARPAATHGELAPWLGLLLSRLSVLEKRPQPVVPKVPPIWQVFNLTGVLTAGAADEWPVPDSRMLTHVNVHLEAAGTTATVVTMYRAGVSIGTVTLGSGVDDLTVAMAEPFKAGTPIKGAVTTAGAGASGVVITPKTVLA